MVFSKRGLSSIIATILLVLITIILIIVLWNFLAPYISRQSFYESECIKIKVDEFSCNAAETTALAPGIEYRFRTMLRGGGDNVNVSNVTFIFEGEGKSKTYTFGYVSNPIEKLKQQYFQVQTADDHLNFRPEKVSLVPVITDRNGEQRTCPIIKTTSCSILECGSSRRLCDYVNLETETPPNPPNTYIDLNEVTAISACLSYPFNSPQWINGRCSEVDVFNDNLITQDVEWGYLSCYFGHDCTSYINP